MALTTTVLFDSPQQEIATTIRREIALADKIWIVVGFATVEGIKAIEQPLAVNVDSLQAFLVGAATFKAFEALDQLLAQGLPPDRLHVHLGRSRPSNGRHAFYRYHPMLHSKIYYMERTDGSAVAFIGSHNATGFALHGLNGEAAVMLLGPQSDPQFEVIRTHIHRALEESSAYSPAMKEAYAWWTHEFFEGLSDKANDLPRDGESKNTIVILCQLDSRLPKKNDIIYLELPQALGKVQSLRAEVHLFAFERLPADPYVALSSLAEAKGSYWCKILGIETDRGGRELTAHFAVLDHMNPMLSIASQPFRPSPSPGMDQVRVQVCNDVWEQFEYLFSKGKRQWWPIYAEDKAVQVQSEAANALVKLDLIPQEHLPWFLVIGLSGETPVGAGTDALPESKRRYMLALESMTPERGSFVLLSLRRIRKPQSEEQARLDMV